MDYCNHQKIHEVLGALTPADVFSGRARDIASARTLVKEQTLRRRRLAKMGFEPTTENLIQPQPLRESVC